MELKTVLLLTAVLMAYLCAGAALFKVMEGHNEKKSKEQLKEKVTMFLDNNTCITYEEFRQFLEDLLETPTSYLANLATSDSRSNSSKMLPVWDYAGAFTFSVTVVTTIGYGHIYPSTQFGRVLCVVYALFGIPLTLIVLGGIGEQLSKLSEKITKFKLRPDAPALNKWVNIIGLVLAGIVVMFVVPSVIFYKVEGWDWFTSVYYCFITLSTIGFGDYVAGSAVVLEDEVNQNIYRIMVYVWILIGLSYLSLVIKSLTDVFLSKAEKVQKEAMKRVPLHMLSNITQNLHNGGASSAASATNDKLCNNCQHIVQGTISLGEDNNGVSLMSISYIDPPL